ncbi:helix-turn-helix transcriptional regulator [Paenibacillus sp. MWE-103]|uniref:Helix-turn-helix transcriptional regulator n=1 Tax=Paenibacillus artemisiicola TaxID=1172618 RepID=A0ABS3W480_9BACL|nr:AraC family transcriptional regulator [Paenibacillus artemisiicola]MBO7743107.1 helix-turn-helix transcriptional regulator [Paenibacillus artemisiicola]
MKSVKRVLEWKTLFSEGLPVHVTRTKEGFYIEQHVHDFVEIVYVEEGEGFHYIEDELIRVRRGDVFYLPVGTSHVLRPIGQPPSPQLVVYNCVIDPLFLKRLQDLHELALPFCPATGVLPQGGQDKVWYAFSDRSEQIGAIFHTMFTEYALQGAGCKTALTGWLLLLHVKLFQRDQVASAGQRSAGKQLDVAFEWLDHQIDGPVSLAKAAAKADMSPRHFYRLFKERTGQTFLEYVQHKRIAKSCLLLETTDLGVSEIAYATGYKDLKSFYRTFRKLAGSTPTAYRRMKSAP